ncbi:MAG: aspartate--tRNA ligase [Deltaproteobacteria bacterium]|nr:aspartate--tRNA ligase [Deltaproteobacteria bacterium]
MARFIDEQKRTHMCGELRAGDVGREVVLFGWVARRRDLGGCVFIDLRDREGVAQVIFDATWRPAAPAPDDGQQIAAASALASEMRREWVIGVRGLVVHRGENVNPDLPTGEIELRALEAAVFNRAETPPFSLGDQVDASDELRLEHRYLDLRRPPLQHVLRLRHEINQATRHYLAEQGCLELETPMMVKYTPGGARNFLVPSRLSPGKFYALAESPQLFKQLFMVAGFDRYFQIVKCFRDEDLRLDRQPEFTQIDIELSFCTEQDVFRIVEGLMFRIFEAAGAADLRALYPAGQFPRMSFADSLRRYGNDKPDLRFGLELVDLTDIVIEHGGGAVPPLAALAAKFRDGTYRREHPAEVVKALVIPASAGLSRKQLEQLEAGLREIKGFVGLGRAKLGDDGSWTGSAFAKQVTDGLRAALGDACRAGPGDIICFQFGPPAVVDPALAKLRLDLGRRLGLVPEHGSGGKWQFLWVVGPPLFERDPDSGRLVAAHHAFTRPRDEHLSWLESDPDRVLCYRYDLVLNGFEIGGGSIRVHDPAVQRRIFAALGIGEDEASEKFGFLLRALRSGAPPHGGIAIGMDRLAMLVAEAQSLRDVIPFPKTNQGVDLMSGAPVPVAAEQLAELRIRSAAGERETGG